jgi:hypothetical protein
VDALRVQALDEVPKRTRAMPYAYGEVKSLWAPGPLEAARGDLVAARKHFTQALEICSWLGEGLCRKHINDDLENLEVHCASRVPEE